MRQKTKKLTDSEKQVLDLLWDSEEPLTSTEIVKLCAGRTWKPSYIHIMINSLLDKGVIVTHNFKKTTKNYARAFIPSLTKDQWIVASIRENYPTKKDVLRLFTTLIEEEKDPDVLDYYAEQLNQRRRTLKFS